MSTATQPFRLTGHVVLPEPKLRFGSNDPQATDLHPMEGLIRFRPNSLGKLSPVPNPIRVGMIVPAELEEALGRQMRELEQVHQPLARRARPKEEFGRAQDFWSRKARDRGVLSEKDLERHLR